MTAASQFQQDSVGQLEGMVGALEAVAKLHGRKRRFARRVLEGTLTLPFRLLGLLNDEPH